MVFAGEVDEVVVVRVSGELIAWCGVVDGVGEGFDGGEVTLRCW